jgi:hypothetical protein
MSSRATGRADAPPRWLISFLAGILASGGLAAWVVGGAVDARELGALVGTILGGFLAGAALGRYRDLVPASAAAAVPLALFGLFGVPAGTFAELARLIILILAAVQSLGVLVGGMFGVAASQRRAIGPARSQAAIALLALGAGAVATGWLWFALTLARGT